MRGWSLLRSLCFGVVVVVSAPAVANAAAAGEPVVGIVLTSKTDQFWLFPR